MIELTQKEADAIVAAFNWLYEVVPMVDRMMCPLGAEDVAAVNSTLEKLRAYAEAPSP